MYHVLMFTVRNKAYEHFLPEALLCQAVEAFPHACRHIVCDFIPVAESLYLLCLGGSNDFQRQIGEVQQSPGLVHISQEQISVVPDCLSADMAFWLVTY